MNNNEQSSKLLVFSVVLGDVLWMNALLAVLYVVWPHFNAGGIYSGSYWEMMAFNTLCYVVSAYYNGVVLHLRKKRNIHIIGKVTKNCLMFVSISVAFIALAGYDGISTRFLVLFHLVNYLVLILWRLSCYHLLKRFRQKGHNTQACILVGSGKNIRELYKEMTEPTLGYRVRGYFDFAPDEQLSEKIDYLGTPDHVVEWMKEHKVDNVYCGLHSSESEVILPIIYWCEQNFTHFFNVPNVRNYLHRRMWYDTVGDVPVLSLHREPLNDFDNRMMKRAFDFVMSGLFLCTVFPFIYLIVGGIIKITSPGPIFFKQKRNGINGKEFWCYKFRSMKVNKDADKVQATKNDPRKTKFGDFMRKTNIDELPQLINVFLGDMSLVGPRPHMLKHTEEYSALIDNYMVRHLVKPGITGWAQVTGFRGETKELHQMVGRVEADIWYMEHWSFLLDLFIIYKTFANVIKGEKEAY
ncbi:MAG: undecaprenyl-phosphate glucose phosphotransferase [Bacteroidaceae bacterium]|nr:undecaprenyl-phosphate glucose phosphotransferase [Bacteroidaceae bacterium]